MYEPERPTGAKKQSRSRSAKAGLIMPVSKVDRRIKTASGRSTGTAAVYLAAVSEYLIGEIFQAAMNHADNCKRRRITAEDLCQGIRADPELHRTASSMSFCIGDKLKHIPRAIRVAKSPPPPEAL